MGLDAIRFYVEKDHLFVYDTDATRSFRQLRALPAMAYFGFTTFTYPKSWSQLSGTEMFTLFEHDHTHIDDIDVITEPTCVITNQAYEEHTPYSIGRLRNLPREGDGRLAIFADDRSFQIQNAKRPLRDQHMVTTQSYRGIYDAFSDHYNEGGYTMPLSDTMNLFVQDNAILYRSVSGNPVQSADELFSALDKAPYLPLYGSMCRIFNRDQSFGASPLSAGELEAFAGWLRRRIGWENKKATEVAESLNQRVLEDNKTFAHATRVDHPKNAEAKSFQETLNPDSHSLQRRLHDWIGEVIA